MKNPERPPGWDAQAIGDIAAKHYGDLVGLYEAHGWPERGQAMMPAQQGHVAREYRTVEAFVAAHANGVEGNATLNPMATITADPPDVWLTSLYGFRPDQWGFLGFTLKRDQTHFLNASRPGALVVIYGAGGAHDAAERWRVLGIQQQSHLTGTKWGFLSPEAADGERIQAQADADKEPNAAKKAAVYNKRRDKWQYAVKAVRAWRIPPERRPTIQEFAPESYWPKRGTVIGAQGVKLSPADARRLLDLDIVEVPVYGGAPVEALIPGPAQRILSPSRPGPVSQTGYLVREAEGPKHLYILRLQGHEDHFLGYQADGGQIVKVGFSSSPSTRCDAYSRALPAGAFEWKIEHSTFEEGRNPYPSSRHALAGERVMKNWLDGHGKSLGGEFFLAGRGAIEHAWGAAKEAAEKWKP